MDTTTKTATQNRREKIQDMGRWEDDGGQNVDCEYAWLPVVGADNEMKRITLQRTNHPLSKYIRGPRGSARGDGSDL